MIGLARDGDHWHKLCCAQVTEHDGNTTAEEGRQIGASGIGGQESQITGVRTHAGLAAPRDDLVGRDDRESPPRGRQARIIVVGLDDLDQLVAVVADEEGSAKLIGNGHDRAVGDLSLVRRRRSQRTVGTRLVSLHAVGGGAVEENDLGPRSRGGSHTHSRGVGG